MNAGGSPRRAADLRGSPDEAFIAAIRRRFPVEAEMDRVLTRKMTGRSGPGFSPLPLDRLVEGIRGLVSSEIGDDFALGNVRWLTGGASKIQVAFDLDWTGPERGARRVTPMVLRMEPPESVVETSRRREFEVLRVMEGVVPVPPCHWVDPDARFLPYPALVYGFVSGVAKPTK